MQHKGETPYRLLVRIGLPARDILVVMAGTHAEYDRWGL
ncbi:MAG: type II toxin-antitoxin system HigB family toxin [Betaproteobacteria bacterium]|nr:type II toxin-antitoxin system HigB family toxin [Betaproteobacteria bacterium]